MSERASETSTNGVGDSSEIEHVVTAEDTALALGSGDVEVLATPRLVAWCEGATVAAVAARLGPGETTVGTRVELDHLRPTTVGRTVRVRAVVAEIADREVVFDVDARDDAGQVGRGRVHRVRVDRRRFTERAHGRPH